MASSADEPEMEGLMEYATGRRRQERSESEAAGTCSKGS